MRRLLLGYSLEPKRKWCDCYGGLSYDHQFFNYKWMPLASTYDDKANNGASLGSHKLIIQFYFEFRLGFLYPCLVRICCDN